MQSIKSFLCVSILLKTYTDFYQLWLLRKILCKFQTKDPIRSRPSQDRTESPAWSQSQSEVMVMVIDHYTASRQNYPSEWSIIPYLVCWWLIIDVTLNFNLESAMALSILMHRNKQYFKISLLTFQIEQANFTK